MIVTTTPAPDSSVLLEVELPPDRLDRSMDEAVRRLARRTRVAGFRPGKAPRFMLERVLGPTAVLDEGLAVGGLDEVLDGVIEHRAGAEGPFQHGSWRLAGTEAGDLGPP